MNLDKETVKELNEDEAKKIKGGGATLACNLGGGIVKKQGETVGCVAGATSACNNGGG